MAEYKLTTSRDARWYVASCRDGDAHLARSIAPGEVVPLCGRAPFRPFAALSRPSDPEQGCAECLIRKAHEMLIAERVAAGRAVAAELDREGV